MGVELHRDRDPLVAPIRPMGLRTVPALFAGYEIPVPDGRWFDRFRGWLGGCEEERCR